MKWIELYCKIGVISSIIGFIALILLFIGYFIFKDK